MPALATPLILTLALNAEAAAFFNQQRKRYFPPERNYLDAHLTLFHHLPGPEHDAVAGQLAMQCRRQRRLLLQVRGLQFMGRGVAYSLHSPELQALHRELQRHWLPALTPQDRQGLRPHVTVQNKVTPEAARALYQQLDAGFVPFGAVGIGLQLWAYRQGPWEHLSTFEFESE